MQTMNYQGLSDRYGRPKKKKTNGERYYSASTWMDYKDWLREMRLKEELQEKASKHSKKNCPKAKRKAVRKAGNSLKSNPMTYDEQLKDERWLRKRKDVLDKKGHICSECGSRSNLEVHHLKYKKGRMAWEYPMSNFVVLCRNCHKKVHGLI